VGAERRSTGWQSFAQPVRVLPAYDRRERPGDHPQRRTFARVEHAGLDTGTRPTLSGLRLRSSASGAGAIPAEGGGASEGPNMDLSSGIPRLGLDHAVAQAQNAQGVLPRLDRPEAEAIQRFSQPNALAMSRGAPCRAERGWAPRRVQRLVRRRQYVRARPGCGGRGRASPFTGALRAAPFGCAGPSCSTARDFGF
jgi:hypothetical protein